MKREMQRAIQPDYILLEERTAFREPVDLEQAISAVLAPSFPASAFVEGLGRDLLEEAVAQQVRRRQLRLTFGIAGVVAGGLFSILGGVLLWHSWQRRREAALPGLALAPAQP